VAAFSPSVVQVILVGPSTILSELKPNDVRLIVDLFGYTQGVHRVKPVVLRPAGITGVSVIPETVEVEILPAPALTPVPDDT